MTEDGWLDAETFALVQRSVPVLCVDVLVWRDGDAGRQVCLIHRDVPQGGRTWCLVGGRVRLDEPLADAVRREVRSALGVDVRDVAPHPHVVAEYERDPGSVLHDPRQHSVALTWAVRLDAEPTPGGEALDARWFAADDLPPMGFGQAAVVRDVLHALP